MAKFIGTKEAAQKLNIGMNSMLRICQTRHMGFPVVKLGRKYLINECLLDEWARRVAEEGGPILS